MGSANRSSRTKLTNRPGSFDFSDFCVLIKDDQKADLIDGVIHMASPENLSSGRLSHWLIRLLGDFLEIRDLGELFGSRTAFRLGDDQSPEPDLAFVRKNRLHLKRQGYFNGPPDAAMEIVSPESVQRDYLRKRQLYEAAGVAEYWIIDEEMKKVTLLRLDARNKYHEIRPRQGVLRSQVITGFWIRIDWLWEETRPSKAAALRQILGEA